MRNNIKLTILILCKLLTINTAVCANDKVLNVYAWSGYLSGRIIQLFEKQSGIRVNHSTFLSNEVLYAKLKANPDSRYDVIMPSTYFINKMIKQNLLQKLDKTKLNNFKNINPIFLNKEYDQNNDYSIPYLYNSTGIAINTKYHPKFKKNPEILWKDLWDPQYKDQLLIFDDTRETFAMALMKLGYSINDTDPQHIKEAFQELKLLMPNIKLFNTAGQRSIYLDEDISMGMGWNGDIYLASKDNSNVTMIYPKDGFLIALDCLAIPKNAKHIAYAHQFINFLLDATIAKDIALLSGFSTANLAGMNLLPEDIKTNPVVYPDHHVMQRSQILNDVGEANLIYEKYFELLRS